MVPTVERGLRLVVFCSMEMAGDKPSIESTSGRSTLMFFMLCKRAPQTEMYLIAMCGLLLQFRGRTYRIVRKRMSAAVLPYLNRQYPCWSNEGRVSFRAELRDGVKGHAPSISS